MPEDTDVTPLLIAWSRGEEVAAAPLIDAVDGKLRRLAGGYLVGERCGDSLAATALVQEAYVKLFDQRQVRWQDRVYLFAVASRVMRRLLVDQVRAHAAAKRGAGLTVSLDGIDPATPAEAPDVIALAITVKRD